MGNDVEETGGLGWAQNPGNTAAEEGKQEAWEGDGVGK